MTVLDAPLGVETRTRVKVIVLSAAMLAAATTAQALSIVVGDHTGLQPELAAQVVPIFINAEGGEIVQSLYFRATEGDGGPDVGGTDIAFKMTGDITGPGTLFEHNNTGTTDASFGPFILDLQTDAANGPITLPPGLFLLGTITFDTTGVIGGFPLLMAGGIGGDTVLAPYVVGDQIFPLTIENGFVSDFPEPSTFVLFGIGVVGFACVRRRRRRKP
jgi:PEP-CTERM motif